MAEPPDRSRETPYGRRGFFRLLACALAGVFSTTLSAEAANYGYHAGHRCPRCQRVVTGVYRWRNDGRHWHRCGSSLWFH